MKCFERSNRLDRAYCAVKNHHVSLFRFVDITVNLLIIDLIIM